LILILLCIVHYIYVETLVWLNKKKIEGEVAFITGGASGIGKILADKLVGEKVTVVICDLNQEQLDNAVKDIKSVHKDGKIFSYVLDVTNYQKVNEVAEKVKNEVGKVTMLINNAGIVTGKTFQESTEIEMMRVMNVNCISHFWTIKAFLPEMIKNNHGHIITIASAAGIAGCAGLVDYCASKFGAFGFNESLSLELKNIANGVNTLVVCPYFINTGMFDGVVTKFPSIFPILSPNYVVNRIIHSIKRRDKELYLPYSLYVTFIARMLSPSKREWIADFFGINDSMRNFKGRTIQDKKKD